MGYVKRIIRKLFNIMGLDVVKAAKNPKHSLIGLRNLPINTIIDIGANTGQFSKYISRIYPEAEIHCFEPVPEVFFKLAKWAKKQKKKKIETYNYALGGTEEVKEMFLHINHTPSSSFLKTTQLCEKLYPFLKNQRSISVKQISLDRCIKKLSIFLKPDILIKLDVQGYEDRVIEGGREVFTKAKACILEICIDKLYDGQPSFYEVSRLLNELGFHYIGNLNQNYAKDGHVIFIDAVFIK